MRRFIKLIITVVISTAAVLPACAAGENEVEAALETASEYRYSEALTHYRIAAQLGNVAAQCSAGLMVLYGEALYGSEIRADHAEAMQWLGLAAKGGCEVSTFVLAKLAARKRL